MVLFVEKVFLYFILFSFLGWSWESLQYTFENKRFINRGFLKGPYCPIYGWGAIIIIAFLHSVENVFALFFCGALLCTTLEYMTSFIMEKIFNKRWWDYSQASFNLHGRVCLLCSTTFGVLSALLLKVVKPIMDGVVDNIPINYLNGLFVIVFPIYIADNLYSFSIQTYHIRDRLSLDRFKKLPAISQFSNGVVLRISEKIFGDNDNE